MKDNEKVIHKVLREETPVLADVPEIILDNEDFLAVDKPSSMPVHACGNFRYNTLVEIVQREHKLSDLKTVHRLDR